MDKLNAISVFCKVIETQSFTQAANQQNISVAMASKLVSQLEEHLKTRLLQRTTRKIVPTEAGMLYYQRCQAILLEKAGVPNAYEGAKALANGEVTRAHYARYLVQIGKVSNDGQAFKRYLGGGKSCFVKAEWVDIPTAIDTIHAAGGVAVIAHPMRYNMTGKWIRRLIVDFKQWGGDGMEVADSGQTKDQRQYLARLANEYDLAASLGSDFHFPCGWIELGKNLFLPEEVKPIWTLFE